MTLIPRDTIVAVDPGQRALDDLAGESSLLGFEIVDVAGFLDHVDQVSKAQIAALAGARASSAAVSAANDAVRAAVREVEQSTGTALGEADASLAVVRDATHRMTGVAQWVGEVSQRLDEVETTLTAVRGANSDIAGIAAHINILAINAKIEAARAGDAGRGFAVVAEAINELSRKTAKAAEGVATSVDRLSAWCEGLAAEAAEVRSRAEQLVGGAQENDAAVARIAEGLRAAQTGTGSIAEATARTDAELSAFRPAFDGIARGLEATAAAVAQARDRVDGMIDRSERMLQGTVSIGGTSGDSTFILRVQEDAAKLSARLEAAVDDGRIALDDLFSSDYRQIPASNPAQFLAPFTKLTDALFPEVQEAALTLSPRVVFCAAVDRNGYLPTHNRKFSAPQGADPVWNAANCRNRRIFDDRVGLKAGRSTAPFLLQVYRRDMGGGEFKMMKDLSSPVRVKGRHWGGLRLAYTF
jgi:methyl-accepting chemotaxis protein